MADPLAALSLLIAAFAVVFGLWQPTAAAALNLRLERHRASRNGQIGDVKRALWLMLALMIAVGALAVIFMPRAWSILRHAVKTGGQYDDLRTAFIAAEAILTVMLGVVTVYVTRLAKLLQKLCSSTELDPDA